MIVGCKKVRADFESYDKTKDNHENLIAMRTANGAKFGIFRFNHNCITHSRKASIICVFGNINSNIYFNKVSPEITLISLDANFRIYLRILVEDNSAGFIILIQLLAFKIDFR